MAVLRSLLIVLVLSALMPSSAAGQADPPPDPLRVVISGHVLDADTRAPVAAASVTASGQPAVTDKDGHFTLTISRGPTTMQVEAARYLPESRLLDISRESATLTIEILLVNRSQFSETVSVTGETSRVQVPAAAATPVSPAEVRSVAGAVDNVFRVLQTLPGVAAADEFGSRLTVRGGGPDQNLTVMDGVEIHNPYRLFGLTSAFNPETVEGFELTAGGFSPKYGDRLSSLLVIDNRPGIETRRAGGSATIGITDANIVFEGKLPRNAPGSWLITGRRTYYDLIAGKIIGESLPSFGDLQANVTLLPRPGQRLVLTGLLSREHTDAVFDDEATDERFGLKANAKNDLVSASYFTALGTVGSSRTVVSWYRNTDSVDVDGRFNNDVRRSNAPGPPPFEQVRFRRSILLRDVAVREEASFFVAGTHHLQAGAEYHALDTGWGWAITGDRNPAEANGSSVRGGAGLPALLNSSRTTSRAGAWLADRWDVASSLSIEPGLRVDYSGANGEWTASPRLSLAAEPGGGVRLRAAGGLYTQSPGYEKLLQSDYFVDLTSTDGLALRSERSWHGILAVERDLGLGLTARVEGYVKTFDNLLLGRLETAEETRLRLAPYRFPAELAASLPTSAQITSVPTNTGGGRAAGFDVYLSRKAQAVSDRFTGWASYTYGRAHSDAYDRSYPFDYDRRHALSAVASYRLSRLLELAVTVRVASGFPTTPALGLRVGAVESTGPDGTVSLVPEQDADGRLVYTVDLGGVENLNTARLPVFARVDTRLTFRPGWMAGRWQIYLEVINVTNRRNAGALAPKLEYDPTSDRPMLTYSREEGIPLLPSFGLRFRF
jgi:hypothetical protein